MPKRTGSVTKELLINAPLPQATATYTVIPHDFVISSVEQELKAAGLEIEQELYKATDSAQVASGVLHLKQGEDQEMRMMFAWANSYDKSMRFKCAIGGYLPQSGSILVSGNMGSWGRKHTGSAAQQTLETIKHQIHSADMYYTELINDKAVMKNVLVPERRKAEVLGILYFEHGLLTGEQLGIIKQQHKNPSFSYNADKDSLWTLYCHVIYSLQRSHPKNWLDQQRLIHFFMTDIFDIYNHVQEPAPAVQSVPEVDPRQITLDQAIAEVESNGQGEIQN
jgi:hypothetical protein